MSDTEIIDVIQKNRWQITFNHRAGRWIVQTENQVVGNIGSGISFRNAVQQAQQNTENRRRNQ